MTNAEAAPATDEQPDLWKVVTDLGISYLQLLDMVVKQQQVIVDLAGTVGTIQGTIGDLNGGLAEILALVREVSGLPAKPERPKPVLRVVASEGAADQSNEGEP